MSLVLCERIAKKIEIAGLGEISKTIFVESMPAEIKRGILVKMSLAGSKIDHELPGLYRPKIQIIVRAQSHADGENLATAILNLLQSKQDTIWNDASNNPLFLMKQFLPYTMPIIYPRSDGNGLEVSVNFDLCYVVL